MKSFICLLCKPLDFVTAALADQDVILLAKGGQDSCHPVNQDLGSVAKVHQSCTLKVSHIQGTESPHLSAPHGPTWSKDKDPLGKNTSSIQLPQMECGTVETVLRRQPCTPQYHNYNMHSMRNYNWYNMATITWITITCIV